LRQPSSDCISAGWRPSRPRRSGSPLSSCCSASAPKSYAVENTESWSIRVARPLKSPNGLHSPLVVLFDYLTRQINRLTGSTTGAIETPYVTRDEIQEMIESGEREGF